MKINLNEIEARKCRQSYYYFFKKAVTILEPDTNWHFNWHIELICNKLQNEAIRIINQQHKDKDLLLNVPPRTSKSLITSVVFPVWCWLQKPTLKFITISYSQDAATTNAFDSKRLIESEWFKKLFPNSFHIRNDSKSKSDYMNDFGGYRRSFGNTGSITGKGADIIIFDDPQNPGQADSPVERENVINLFNKTIKNRLNDPKVGIRIIVQQRLHQDDLSGYILTTMPHEIEHICLPAILSNDIKPLEYSKYYIDNFLDPFRLDDFVLRQYRNPASLFAGQYMQNPVPIDGDIVKRIWLKKIDNWTLNEALKSYNTYDKRGNLEEDSIKKLNWHLFIDPAEGIGRDYHGILIATEFQNDLYIRYTEANHLSIPDLIRHIMGLVDKYGHRDHSKIYVEPRSQGRSIIQTIRQDTKLNVVEGIQPKDSKENRLKSHTTKMEAGRIKLIKGDWNEQFIDELIAFPHGKHDDLVDVFEMAVRKLLQQQYQNNWTMV